ncbi:EAL domain-containing protein [Frankia sp. CN7]|uniref:EAL domain-containing protein n=2 Tax=Frankia nepalensis TaxID=1836974 RepID=A0A937RAZ4_9ACTN|nr:EAL domain-containing protein [Frankia nepalensis]MBL7502692.1 EAL domain-containing protein [Frankia nepalensis]MBL7626427.1 EAL domain-containing protein [Frankia nepalensis]
MIAELLAVARKRLGMDVAWLARLVGEQLLIEHVEGDTAAVGVRPGFVRHHRDTICGRVLEHGHPHLIPDTRPEGYIPGCEAVAQIGVGCYAGTPIRLSDGSTYGLLGCGSSHPDPTRRARDTSFLALIAEVIAGCLWSPDRALLERELTWRRITSLIDSGGPDLAFQPIFETGEMAIVGLEALSRFPPGSGSAEKWFADATRVGLGVELELIAIRNAFQMLSVLPPAIALGVNASPSAIRSPALRDMIGCVPAERVFIEITEHEPIEDYGCFVAILETLRRTGVRIALDDVGSGYARMDHVLELHPDALKTDRLLVERIDTDPTRAALLSAFSHFARKTGTLLVAEGVETAAQLKRTIEGGADAAQGYYLAAPAPLARRAPARRSSEY